MSKHKNARYEIVRYWNPGSQPYKEAPIGKVMCTGLTLSEAQAHCQDPSTRKAGVWFDGYRAR